MVKAMITADYTQCGARAEVKAGRGRKKGKKVFVIVFEESAIARPWSVEDLAGDGWLETYATFSEAFAGLCRLADELARTLAVDGDGRTSD